MPDPVGISKPKQLLVEGKDGERFFIALLKRLDVQDMQIQNFGAVSELSPFLRTLKLIPGFGAVASIGIIRDAEANPTSAFESVCGGLRGAELPVPSSPEGSAGTRPRTRILILPDSSTVGMLETLCLRSVVSDPAMRCVHEYLACLEQRLATDQRPRNNDKASIQAFLASRRDLKRLLGEAADAGIWPWEDAAFDHVKQFLQRL